MSEIRGDTLNCKCSVEDTNPYPAGGKSVTEHLRGLEDINFWGKVELYIQDGKIRTMKTEITEKQDGGIEI